MRQTFARYLVVPALFALLGLSVPASIAGECREHGQPVDSSVLLDAMDVARVEDLTDGDAPADAPHEADKTDGGWDVAGTFGPVKNVRFSTDEGTWMNVDVHPSGNVVVFDLLGDLYTLPIEGGRATRITEGAAFDFQPRFGPEGKRLLFSSDRGGGFNIWVADFEDGKLGEPRALTEEKKQLTDGAGAAIARRCGR